MNMKMGYGLWLDDLRNPQDEEWGTWMYKNNPTEQPFVVVWVKSFTEFCDKIKKDGVPVCIFFDHDLGSDISREKVKNGMSKTQARKEKRGTKTGMDCAKWLVEYCLDNNVKMPPYAIQSANPAGKENIDGLLKGFIKHQEES